MSIYISKKPRFTGVVPSNNIQHRNDATTGTTSVTPTKVKEIITLVTGVWRVEFKLYTTSTTATATGRIYRNGNPYGTTRETSSTSPVTFQEDLFFHAGDFIQLYLNTSDPSYPAVCRDFRLLGDFADQPAYNTLE